jgi:Na+-transporting methylmalonyl-CoA/oxaloacetate decarboxylase gamma subunit
MWPEATKVAIIGFSVVFITLWLLAISVKVMSFFCKKIQHKGGK